MQVRGNLPRLASFDTHHGAATHIRFPPAFPPQSLVCTAAYILGEYGRLIRAEVPPAEQYRLLHGAFPAASQPTKGLLMTALLKVRSMGLL